mmetsp:Transcript_21895/g.28343  ORF Transcript_21895/g.28343 Transcript_21895/m.28343 type:complete len:172 (-) Transcript_21895:210-725(-)
MVLGKQRRTLSYFLICLLAAALSHVGESFVVIGSSSTMPTTATSLSTKTIFVVSPTAATRNNHLLSSSLSKKSKITSLYDSKADLDGTGRGIYILAFSFLVSLWMFSIPTEFRRAHFCPNEQCTQNRASCYDCVTTSEWTTGIEEYYKGGGGIKWDFHVDQSTKDLWAGKL